jgi:nitrate reductase alpha subunit
MPQSRGRARLSQLYKRFTSLGPLMDKLGNGGKGIGLEHRARGRALWQLNGVVPMRRPTKGMRQSASKPTSTPAR